MSPFDWVMAANYTPEPHVRRKRRWLRVSRSKPCTICGKPDWCWYSDDGTAAGCMRVSDGSVYQREFSHGMGWLHVLRADAPVAPTRPVPNVAPRPKRPWLLDWPAILKRWEDTQPADSLTRAAADLRTSVTALQRLRAVYSTDYHALAFPMCNARHRIIGVRLRAADGRKWAVTGSHNGIFLPDWLDSKPPLWVCEGPTDTAAALSLGFNAIGLPSAGGAADIVCEMLELGRRREVVIVADEDGPGRAGAQRLANRILGLAKRVYVITAAPYKDIRAAVAAGTRSEGFKIKLVTSWGHGGGQGS